MTPRTDDAILTLTREVAPAEAQAFLESGGVVVLPDRAFDLDDAAEVLFGEVANGRAKNISYNPKTRELKGSDLTGAPLATLEGALARYSDWAEALVGELLPGYAASLQRGKASFRPRAADQPMSPRKDDRRLHVDSFPSQPVQGRRILRVFRNVDPAGAERVWNVGEPFRAYAERFLPRARPAVPGAGPVLQALKLTKGRRTAYDHVMLQLHDAAKADEAYQTSGPRQTVRFRPGETWMTFTDATVHAALSGRNAFEQTFLLPVQAMADPAKSPLRVLEAMTGRALA